MHDRSDRQGARRRGSSARPAVTSAGGGVDLLTLTITAVSSAAAAYVTSKVWAPGTLASAAFTPVIVALVREALQRPTEVVVRTVPMPGAPRTTRRRRLPDDLGERLEQGAPAPLPPPIADAPEGVVRYHRAGVRGLPWRRVLVTGLLGFVVCALILTVPELLAGQAASGGGRGTTLFGGHERHRSPQTTTTPTSTEPARTVTVPATTVTAPAPAQTTSAPPPQTTTTPPPTATTAPPTTTAPPAPAPP